MSKMLKRLYLGDVVKTFGTKRLRKLTTEEPQDDSVVGTWLIKKNPEGGQVDAWYPVDGYFYGEVYSGTPFVFNVTQCPIQLIRISKKGNLSQVVIINSVPNDEDRCVVTGYGSYFDNWRWSSSGNVEQDEVNSFSFGSSISSNHEELCRTIIINSEPRYEYFKAWLRANADKIS